MHLYVMQKSEIMLTIVTFISMFVLCLFIGLAGPNSVRLDPVVATKMLEQQQQQQQQSIETNQHNQDGRHRPASLFGVKALMSERYYIMTPLVSSYCQQLNLWIKFDLVNITAEALPNFEGTRKTDTAHDSTPMPIIEGNEMEINRINQMSEVLSDIHDMKGNDPIIVYIDNNHNNGNDIDNIDQSFKNVRGTLKRSIQLDSINSIGRSHRSQRIKEQVNGVREAEEDGDQVPAERADLHNLPISIYFTAEAFEESPSVMGKSEAHIPDRNSNPKSSSYSHHQLNHSVEGDKTKTTPLSHQRPPSSEYLSGKRITLRRNLTCNYNRNGPTSPLFTINTSGAISHTEGGGGGGFECRPIEMIHLNKLDYASYKFGIYFTDETIDKISKLAISHRVELREIIFTLQSINTSFTILIIWFRFVLLLLSIATTCFFITCLYKYPIRDWSMEQRWTTILLVLLIASDSK